MTSCEQSRPLESVLTTSPSVSIFSFFCLPTIFFIFLPSLKSFVSETDSADIMHLMARWTCLNPRPATIMFICPYSKVSKNDMNHLEEKWGCHVIKQFTYDSPGSQSYFGNFLRLEGVILSSLSVVEISSKSVAEPATFFSHR